MNNDRQSLIRFLEDLRLVLVDFVDDRDALLPVHLRQRTLDAWGEVRTIIDKLRTDLSTEVTDPPEMDDRFARAGLAGKQLQLKLDGYNEARKQPKPDFPRRKRGWFGRIFGWANVLLGSLATVLPGAEALKEFKESLEQGLKELHDND